MVDPLECNYFLILISDLDRTLKVPKSSTITFEFWSRIDEVLSL